MKLEGGGREIKGRWSQKEKRQTQEQPVWLQISRILAESTARTNPNFISRPPLPEPPTHAVTTWPMPLNACGSVCIPRHRDVVKSFGTAAPSSQRYLVFLRVLDEVVLEKQSNWAFQMASLKLNISHPKAKWLRCSCMGAPTTPGRHIHIPSGCQFSDVNTFCSALSLFEFSLDFFGVFIQLLRCPLGLGPNVKAPNVYRTFRHSNLICTRTTELCLCLKKHLT